MTQLCRHCATPCSDDSDIEGFCCAGCRQVYQLIQDQGLDDYYHWQDRATRPLKDRPISAVDADAYRRAQATVEAGTGRGQAVFSVEGMSCMGCAWLIKQLAAQTAGVVEAECHLSSHSLRLEWQGGGFQLPALATELARFGYRLDQPRPVSTKHLSPMAQRLSITGIFTGNALLLAAYTHFI
jgi:Cu2+-exporting ATPase